jgi:alpha-amylase
MLSLCFYFQVHQPYRVKKYRVFDIGQDEHYFNDQGEGKLNNKKILKKVAYKSYIPATRTILELLKKHPEFRVAYSFSGIVLEQMQEAEPELIDLFRQLVDTGRVEILAETYYHSLSFFYSPQEFERQVTMHRDLIWKLFRYRPRVFRNTELSYRNDLAHWAERQGYFGVVAEGWDPVLGWRSPNFVYRPKDTKFIRLLLKNYKLSDDIAFRFSSRDWAEWPLTTEKFNQWITAIHGNGETVNLFMDYETFGEHQWEDTGIFEFLRHLPGEVLKHPDTNFKTPSQIATEYPARDEVDIPHILTWADTDRDLTAWVGNSMQHAAIDAVYKMEKDVMNSGNQTWIDAWRKLQTSDHFYYMCTKWFSDGDVHAYFSPYESPYEAFINYMNALNDLRLRVSPLPARPAGGASLQLQTA